MYHIHTCNYKNVVTRIKQTDFLHLKVSDMPSIPAGSNPYHHDSFSMGTDLPRGLMLMHSGFSDENGHEDMYLVNTVTGQRLFLEFQAKRPTFEQAVYIGEEPKLNQEVLYSWVRSYDKAEWYSLSDISRVITAHRNYKGAPLYVVVDKWFVLLSVVMDNELLAEFIAAYEPAPESIASCSDFWTFQATVYAANKKPDDVTDKDVNNG